MADKLTPFTFINSINQGKKGTHLLKDCKADQSLEYENPESPDKAYIPFIINRGFSYFKDTVLCANEMNMKTDLPNRMQYDFYKNMITAKKRFSKWGKKPQTFDDIKLLQKHYNYSREKAESVYNILSKKQIQQLQSLHDKGGR